MPALLVVLVVGSGACGWWWHHNQEQLQAKAAADRRVHAMEVARLASVAAHAAAMSQLQALNAGGANSGGNGALSLGGAAGNAGAAGSAGGGSSTVMNTHPRAAGIIGGGMVAKADGIAHLVSAHLVDARGVAMDSDGDVYVTDGAGMVHRITPDGDVEVSSGAGTFLAPIGATTAPNGNLIVADWQTATVKSLSPDGNSFSVLASTATSPFLQNPVSVATDAQGDVFVASIDNNSIVKIAPDGTVSTFAGTPGQSGSTDGTLANALFSEPRGLATDADGDLFVADEGNSNIREIFPDGTVTTVAGGTSPGSTDGVGSAAGFNQPRGLAVDSDGDIIVADTNNDTIRMIAPDGTVTTLAGTPGQAGNVDGPGNQAEFNMPRGVSVDASGNIYVTDTGNNEVRRIAPDGTVTTVASVSGK
ncbi:MAG: hypothetical protein ABSH19_05740 [Opitutales bacterium]